MPESKTIEELLRAASIYEALGKRLEPVFGAQIASFAYVAAARIDEMNEALRIDLGGPFNGQRFRQALFWNIVRSLSVTAVVETGTYRGVTTEHVARNFSAPVYTCEINRRYFEYARGRLLPYKNVHLARSDSPPFLEQLCGSTSLRQQTVLFYLDAHWSAELPLSNELATILKSHVSGAVMIDDFEVPSDPGYFFDDYGPNKKLCIDILRPYLDQIYGIFFPTALSSEETGKKRGAVVLALSEDANSALSAVKALRKATVI